MIDLYCERTGPGFWAEPFNVLSNAAYLFTAWALIRHTRRWAARRDRQAHVLALLPIAVAIGSALFHVFATPWARRLDEASILVFELLFVWMYARRELTWPRAHTVAGVTGMALAVGAGRLLSFMNGSLSYLPPLLVGLTVGLRDLRLAGHGGVLAATGVFALAIGCRVVDNAACTSIPIGTHFIWHLLTAGVLYAFGRVAIGRAHSAGVVR